MDQESTAVVEFMQGLARVNAQFAHAAIALERRPDAASANRFLNCKRYPLNAGSMVHLYVEVIFRDERSIAWVLDVTGNDREWVIQTSLDSTDPNDYQTLIDHPDRMI